MRTHIPLVVLVTTACGGAEPDALNRSPLTTAFSSLDEPSRTWGDTDDVGSPTESATALGCDAGTTTTRWANNCPTHSTYNCTPGTWTVMDPVAPVMPPMRYQTQHFALRWNGNIVSPDLAQQAGNILEMIWHNHTQTVGFIEPYCSQTIKHKVNVHIDPNFGLTGGGTGDVDPAFWIGPGALQDHWGLAHEFTHSLQFASRGMRNSPYTGWFWESHANFMAHSLPEYRHSNVHCTELSVNFPHIYLGSTRDRYCNWQFLDFLKDLHCYQAVNNLWSTSGANSSNPSAATDDPFSLIAGNQNWTVTQLNDFFGHWAMHNVTWDYRDPDGSDAGASYRAAYGPMSSKDGGWYPGARQLRTTRLDPLDLAKRRFVTPTAWAPQRWGYNLVRLFADPGATSITVEFKGVVQQTAHNTDFGPYANQPSAIPPPNSGWRWGLVAVDANGVARYTALSRAIHGVRSLCINPTDREHWLVVTAAPTTVQKIQWDQMYYTVYRYPWMIQLTGAQPEGFQPGAPNPTANGQRWPNGGGWVAQGAAVDPSVYVEPYAAVLGGRVTGQARIEDHAVVMDATVSDRAVVGGLSVLSGGIVVSGNARVGTVFQGPGSFEGGQSITGSAQIYGDVELRGTGFSLNSGVFYGLIMPSSFNDVTQGAQRQTPVAEVTAPPPYAWSP